MSLLNENYLQLLFRVPLDVIWCKNSPLYISRKYHHAYLSSSYSSPSNDTILPSDTGFSVRTIRTSQTIRTIFTIWSFKSGNKRFGSECLTTWSSWSHISVFTRTAKLRYDIANKVSLLNHENRPNTPKLNCKEYIKANLLIFALHDHTRFFYKKVSDASSARLS